MKKFVLIAIALSGLASTALAGNVSTDVPVDVTVNNSCVFEGGAQALTFDYTAANGIENLQEGVSATLHCNFGTLGNEVAVITPTTPNPMRDTAVLDVTYTVSANDFAPGGPGSQYYGSDTRNYTVTATAPLDQWNRPSGHYTATVNINVDF